MKNYEQKYKEALEVAKRKLCFDKAGMVDSFTPNDIYEIFPELKESEDAKMIKAIHLYLGWLNGRTNIAPKGDYTINDMLAWLEKQGDKDELIKELGEYKAKYTQEVLEKHLRVMNKDDERLRETTISFLKDFADKGYENAVECIDWLEKQGDQKLNGTFVNVDDVREDFIDEVYRVLDADPTNDRANQIIDAFDNLPTVTIEKQGVQPRYNIGDVICDKLCTTLNKEAQPNMAIVDIQNGMYICDKGSFPVSQQDEYVLVGKKIDSKLNDDSVSNELRAASTAHAEKEMKNQTFPDNLEFELVYTFEEGAKWQATQKSSWSKDDDDNLGMIESRLIDLLSYTRKDNSLTKHRKNTIEEEVVGYVNWLTSLKARFTWKPSDTQMIALNDAITNGHLSNANERILKGLQKQLRKLKGE